ncbi:uncharacterized protein [Montipora foliosa]|uniref:uncharacterized protein n=1 Tax=Montipora foliosa TaxID=591990 RepID=UPI0035F1B3C5
MLVLLRSGSTGAGLPVAMYPLSGQSLGNPFHQAPVVQSPDNFVRDQLTAVAELIVWTYPALKDQSVGTGHDSWFVQLYEKFRNERKHLVKDPEVILHKKIKLDLPDGQRVLPSKLRGGALNWEPPYPEGEDEASMKRHKEALENEWRRRNPDERKIEQGMILTFPDRRLLMNQQVPIAEVMGEYPSLFDFSQIIAEFERILGLGTSVLSTFKANFDQVVDPILHVAETKKGKVAEEVKNYLLLLEDNDGDDIGPTAGEKAELAMAVLPFLLQGISLDCVSTQILWNPSRLREQAQQELQKITKRFFLFSSSLGV